jgi:hypothetical protein
MLVKTGSSNEIVIVGAGSLCWQGPRNQTSTTYMSHVPFNCVVILRNGPVECL